jgi:hypothetical protein
VLAGRLGLAVFPIWSRRNVAPTPVKIIHGCTWGDAVCVDGPAKFASIMNVLTLYLRISCSAHFG